MKVCTPWPISPHFPSASGKHHSTLCFMRSMFLDFTFKWDHSILNNCPHLTSPIWRRQWSRESSFQFRPQRQESRAFLLPARAWLWGKQRSEAQVFLWSVPHWSRSSSNVLLTSQICVPRGCTKQYSEGRRVMLRQEASPWVQRPVLLTDKEQEKTGLGAWRAGGRSEIIYSICFLENKDFMSRTCNKANWGTHTWLSKMLNHLVLLFMAEFICFLLSSIWLTLGSTTVTDVRLQ